MAKLAREQAVKERRARKQEKKDDKKQAAAAAAQDAEVEDTASLDDGPCTTATLNQGETDGLVFSAPGSYPFHCNIHPTTMKGTFTISS